MDQLLNQKNILHKELSKSQTDIQELAKAQENINAKLEENKGKLNEAKSKSEMLEQEEFQLIEEAEGYKEARIERAEGDVSKFNSVLKEYRKTKEVTETRMFLETAEEILSNREKIIVPDGKEGSNLINLLNLKAKEGK